MQSQGKLHKRMERFEALERAGVTPTAEEFHRAVTLKHLADSLTARSATQADTGRPADLNQTGLGFDRFASRLGKTVCRPPCEA